MIDLGKPPQTEQYEPGLGRLFAPDERDKKFELPRELVREAKSARPYNYLIPGPVLDQGATSQCVAYSAVAAITGGPFRSKPGASPKEIYDWCQDNDEWAGREPTYYGTSTRASCKWLLANGYIERYEWAQDAEGVLAHILLSRGPVLLGINWYQGMGRTDEHGYIRVSGHVRGGHQVLLRGGSRKRKDPLTGSAGAARIRNSWGQWGDMGRGEAWLTLPDLDRLLAENGDAALLVEKKR